MIEDVESFHAELRLHALPKPEVLADGKVDVVETRIAEDVTAHSAKLALGVGNQYRLAVRADVASGHSQGIRVRSLGLTKGPGGRSLRIREKHLSQAARREVGATLGSPVRTERKRIRPPGLKVRWIAKKIPTIRIFVDLAEIVRLIVDIPGLPGLLGDDGIKRPTLKKLTLGLLLRKRVGHRQGKSVTNVSVTAAMVQIRTRAVHREERNPVGGHVIQAVRIGIAQDKIEAVEITSGKSVLPTVIGGAVNIRELVDVTQVRILGGVRLNPRSRIGLIDINDASKLHSMIAHVSGFQRKLIREGMLDSQGPVLNVGSAEVAIHGEGVAGSRV